MPTCSNVVQGREMEMGGLQHEVTSAVIMTASVGAKGDVDPHHFTGCRLKTLRVTTPSAE